jgi:23S rRNA (adenine2030-N6)-methyltransferase
MTQKEKPLLYLETHAGRGMYDLTSTHALKTAEFQTGIDLLWQKRDKAPSVFLPYLEVLKTLNPDGELQHYPGSPFLALSNLRPLDRLCFSEKHPKEFVFLEQLARMGRRVFLNNADGIQNMQALMPPIERRALIFIDPSYEIKEEYKTIPAAINKAFRRFGTGVFCLWYPIIDNRPPRQLIAGMTNINASKVLQVEFYLNQKPQEHMGMDGCGLWIINPPYPLEDELKTAFAFLKTIFNPGLASYLIK